MPLVPDRQILQISWLRHRFEHVELSAKLLDYFLRSNRCNINQSRSLSHTHTYVLFHTHTHTPWHTRIHIQVENCCSWARRARCRQSSETLWDSLKIKALELMEYDNISSESLYDSVMIKGVVCTRDLFQPCAYPLPKSPLRASVKIAFLVVRIGAQNDIFVHPFQKWPLRASVFRVTKNQHLDPNIRNFGSEYRGFSTEDGPDRRHRQGSGCMRNGSGLCLPHHKQGLDYGTLLLLYNSGPTEAAPPNISSHHPPACRLRSPSLHVMGKRALAAETAILGKGWEFRDEWFNIVASVQHSEGLLISPYTDILKSDVR